MADRQLRSGSGKFSSPKQIAKSKRSREHLALARKLNENNESIVGTSNSDKTPKFVIEGCRIVDLKYVQEQMTGGCSVCQKTLKLDNVINETRQGLASLLYIQCECETTNKIFTSKHHFLNDTNWARIFDINTRCTGGKCFI